MTALMTRIMTSPNLTIRAMRSSGITMLGFAASQAIRLASNLILTRLLYPEAFGMMALVSVFLVALSMFSDVGTGAAIMQSKRGDDPEFVDTAWTIQIGRGAILWVAASVLAWPVSLFYGEPELLYFLPVAALTLLISGFYPTRLYAAHRHLLAGRVTLIDLAAQTVGIVAAVGLAVLLQSVWALVISGIIGALAQLTFLNLFLSGHRNRLRWEGSAAHELIHFGKWVFLATVSAFVISQADKVIVGKYLSLSDFGVYNIGFFLASFPLMLSGMVMSRVLIPIYRESPPSASEGNRLRIRKMRFAATSMLSVLMAILAFGGVWLVELMYDPRYHAAAGVTVLMAVTQMPAIIIQSCDQAALAAGDSRRYFVLTLARGLVMVAFLILGLEYAGVTGALIAQGVAGLATYPVLVWALRKHGAWDPLHDGVFLGFGLLLALAAWEFNAAAIAELALLGPG